MNTRNCDCRFPFGGLSCGKIVNQRASPYFQNFVSILICVWSEPRCLKFGSALGKPRPPTFLRSATWELSCNILPADSSHVIAAVVSALEFWTYLKKSDSWGEWQAHSQSKRPCTTWIMCCELQLGEMGLFPHPPLSLCFAESKTHAPFVGKPLPALG